jgi:cytochrome c553
MYGVYRKCLWPWLPTATLILLLGASLAAFSQSAEFTGPPAVDVLGAHDGGGRGCATCHITHGASSTDATLWGAQTAPDYGPEIQLEGPKGTASVAPADFVIGEAEVSGVILCVSCHDGNVTPQNMMASRSYAQRMGLFPFVRGIPTPTLLGDELASQFRIDHPLGQSAVIPVGDGLEFTNGKFSVKPNSAYARFVQSYGWPSLAPVQRSNPYGVSRAGQPYLVCTTCHNQHAMSFYAPSPGDAIAGDSTGRVYTTFFFVNGPYNPYADQNLNFSPNSSMQFCRQCHFNYSNEGNNTTSATLFF